VSLPILLAYILATNAGAHSLNLTPSVRTTTAFSPGGGGELLANDTDLLVPGNEEVFGSYP
jgi:hypothetical protein